MKRAGFFFLVSIVVYCHCAKSRVEQVLISPAVKNGIFFQSVEELVSKEEKIELEKRLEHAKQWQREH